MIAFIDGVFLKESEAKISIFDRGFLFGDGIFTTIQIKDGVANYLNEHLNRLALQAQELKIMLPSSIKENFELLIEKNKAYIGIYKARIILTGGMDPYLGLPYRQGSVIMMLSKYEEPKIGSLKLALYQQPLNTPYMHLKTLSYLSRLHIIGEAKERGFDDALILDNDGNILESAVANVFWTYDNQFYTPINTFNILNGITLENAIYQAEKKGLKINKVKCTLDQIPEKAYIYITNSLKGVVPVSLVENKKFEIALFN
jgi:branched-subunit amino acid aminotransferase/4-amino-4-deoxychorismate lyase